MLRFRLFGKFGLFAPGGAPGELSIEAKRLCAYLMLNREHAIPRVRVASDLWPAGLSSAQADLESAIAGVRSAVAPTGNELLEADDRTITWRPSAPTWVDLFEFKVLDDRRPADTDPAPRLRALETANSLYFGPLLSDWDDPWVRRPRETLHARWRDVLAELAALEALNGNLSAASAHLRRLIGDDPIHERPISALAAVLYASGDRGAALSELAEGRRRLMEELGVAPMSPMLSLEQDLKRGAVSDDVLRKAMADIVPAARRGTAYGALMGHADVGSQAADSMDERALVPDTVWEQAAPLVSEPRLRRRGRPRLDDRVVLATVIYKFRTGTAWNRLPEELAAASTAHDRYQKWLDAGVIQSLVDAGVFAPEDVGL